MKKLNFLFALLVIAIIAASACTKSSTSTGVGQATAQTYPNQASDQNQSSTSSQNNVQCASNSQSSNLQTQSAIDLKTDMRRLWEDHGLWTRNAIISIVDNLSDQKEATDRLLKNQEDIGNVIKPYYGGDAAKNLTALLKNHIVVAAEIVKAAKAGNDSEVDRLQKNWSANADQIAALLSSANPNWSKSDLSNMLHQHLDLVEKEAVNRIKKDHKAEIDAFDGMKLQILQMSDALSDGIIKQFPDKFK